MIEIFPNLYIGAAEDFEAIKRDKAWRDEWFVISACKEPYHREALGYTGRGAPKDSPEYLIAERPGHLILNLVDAADPAYIRPEIIDRTLAAIAENIGTRKILVHCNQGQSRSPTIGMLYLADLGALPAEHDAALEAFKLIYPNYAPAQGMAEFARSRLTPAA